jgi:transposase InsO family protein
VGAVGPRLEPAAGGKADSDRADDVALHALSRSAGGLARVGRQPCARYGYRRLTVLLKREGWPVNAKRIYRLYVEEGLIVRTQKRRERAQRQRVPLGQAVRPNQKWSMDFVVQRLPDGRWIRVLTVVDQFTRECLTLFADNALSGEKVVTALDKIVVLRSTPESITVDNGTEFASKAMDLWLTRTAYTWTSSGLASRWRTVTSKASMESCGTSV